MELDLEKRARIRRSALWAAYGDALGFITEGVGADGVARRAGKPRVDQTVGWSRRVGGKFGPTVKLPAGCISDDTQLRLATSRSIRANGVFDVETFAKIEMTVWPSYALGGGRGSSEAAANLRNRDVTWATNFFSQNRADYMRGGGNGAAMRIQPHIWSSTADDGASQMTNVVRNAVTTHGHLRGILGAAFHAGCLLYSLNNGQVPDLEICEDIADELPVIADLVQSDPLLAEIWIGQWERRAGKSFASEVATVTEEIREDLASCRKLTDYATVAHTLDLYRPESRGSGTKTAILAAVAARMYRDRPQEAMVACANELGTDTDTIATMVGALLGLVVEVEPGSAIADRDYIAFEADRMWAIGQGLPVQAFRYPSLVSWAPPRSASDCVGPDFAVAGLGPAECSGQQFKPQEEAPATWQWIDGWWGQSLIAKRRVQPRPIPEAQMAAPSPSYLRIPREQIESQGRELRAQSTLFEAAPSLARPAGRIRASSKLSLDEMTDITIASDFDEEVIGRMFIELASREAGIDASVAYAAIISKAWIARRNRRRTSKAKN